jgi:hypothetical protein
MSDGMVPGDKHQESWTALERDTAAYFDSLPEDVQAEESRLAVELAAAVDEIEFDS